MDCAVSIVCVSATAAYALFPIEFNHGGEEKENEEEDFGNWTLVATRASS